MASAATADGARLFKWGIVLGGKRILRGITKSLGPALLWVVWCTLRQGLVLVFINRHSPTMNLVEEQKRGLIPRGLQSWPLQLIKHLTNTTSVVPPPVSAGSAGCRPLYLPHLLYLSFTIWDPNKCCILQFKAYRKFCMQPFSTPRCESQVPVRNLKS